MLTIFFIFAALALAFVIYSLWKEPGPRALQIAVAALALIELLRQLPIGK